jgi:hypothetical protein
MNEADWLSSADPQAMLNFLQASGKASDRKLRLWAAACCRRVWGGLDDQERKNIEMTERYADGAVSDDGHRAFTPSFYRLPFGSKGKLLLDNEAGTVARHWAGIAVLHRCDWDDPAWEWAWEEEERVQSDLLREVFGPLTLLPPISASLLTSNDGLVRRLAEEAYEKRQLPAGTLDPDRLAVLADALLEAGCDDADILGHLRGPGPHWRGCHILDLIMGRG